jgi:hypothetical protein
MQPSDLMLRQIRMRAVALGVGSETTRSSHGARSAELM